MNRNNLFTQARLKLTGWYLLIILLISLSFSGFIYHNISSELERRFTAIEGRLWQRQFFFSTPHSLAEDLAIAKHRVLLLLFYTNGIILLSAAAAGYFLAGKTLSPIEKTLEEQKQFIADASHELKTPLTALQTTTEVALRNPRLGLKEARQVLHTNLIQVKNLSHLTNYLLNLSMHQNSSNSIPKTVFKPKIVLKNTIDQFILISRKKKLNFTYTISDFSINFNYENLEKVVTILLDNAIKYTSPGGRIILKVYSQKQKLVIEVKDSGCGISDNDLPHIFDRFYRAEQSRCKSQTSGFGLGLAIAKQIVEQQHGTITVVSRLGQGSLFTVKIPQVVVIS